MAVEVGNAIVHAVITSDSEVPDLSAQLHDLLPNATVVLAELKITGADAMHVLSAADVGDEQELTFVESFREYVAARRLRPDVRTKAIALFARLLAAQEAEEEVGWPELDVLRLPEAQTDGVTNQPVRAVSVESP